MKFLNFFKNNLPFCQTNLAKKYGKNTWCLIVGASDGIGKEFSFQIAERGFNICLIARSEQKLIIVQKELANKFQNIETKVLVYDFCKQQSDNTLYTRLYNDVKDLDISILINAVGMMKHGKLDELTEDQIKENIYTNIFPFIFVTQKLIPKLISRKQKSLIINLSSLSSQKLMPYLSLYCGTKCFIDAVSLIMSLEYKEKLDVVSLRPNLVKTKLQNMGDDFLFGLAEISPKSCVQGCLSQIGNGASTDGHIWHQIMNFLFQFIPDYVSFLFLRNWLKRQQKLQ